MAVKLIVDDSFLDVAYRLFRFFYLPVYGKQLEVPISFSSITSAVSAYLGVSFSEIHVFYLEDSPSFILRKHLVTLAKELIVEIEGDCEIEHEIGEQNLCDYILNAHSVEESSLLRRSTAAYFHCCDLVSMDAAMFAAKCDTAVVVGDDPVYEIAKQCPNLAYIRLGNEETRMSTDVRWVDGSYILCKAYGVEP